MNINASKSISLIDSSQSGKDTVFEITKPADAR